MGCCDSRARAIQPKEKKIKFQSTRVIPEDSQDRKESPGLNTKEKGFSGKMHQVSEAQINKKTLLMIFKQLEGIKSSVNLLENSIRDMRLKQVKLNELKLKKKWQDRKRKKLALEGKIIIHKRRKSDFAFTPVQGSFIMSRKPSTDKTKPYRIDSKSIYGNNWRRSKSLIPREFTESSTSSISISINEKIIGRKKSLFGLKNSEKDSGIGRGLNTNKKYFTKTEKERTENKKFTFQSKNSVKKFGEWDLSEKPKKVENQSKKAMKIIDKSKDKRDDSSISMECFQVPEDKTLKSMISGPFIIKNRKKRKKRKSKIKKKLKDSKSVYEGVSMPFLKSSYDKTGLRKKGKKPDKMEGFKSADFLKKYDENCEVYKQKKALLEKKLKNGEIKKISIGEKNKFHKVMGKLYGGTVIKRRKVQRKTISLMKSQNSSNPGSPFFFSPNMLNQRRKLTNTPKIPVSYFSKHGKKDRKKKRVLIKKRSQDIDDISPISANIPEKKSFSHLFAQYNGRKSHKLHTMGQNQNLSLKKYVKTPSHSNIKTVGLNNKLIQKEKELEKELNKSNLHHISIENFPVDEQVRVERQVRKKSKMLLNQIGKLFKKLNNENNDINDSDESNLLSSIQDFNSNKKIIKERKGEESENEVKEGFINPYSSEEDDGIVGGSNEKESVISNVTMTVILDRTIDAEGKEAINQYRMMGVLGRGAFGEVKKVKDMKEKKYYVIFFLIFKAMKILNIKSLEIKNKHSCLKGLDFKQEVALHSKMNHKNIVKIIEVIDKHDDDHIYLVLEYAKYGAICSGKFWRVRKKNKKKARKKDFPEKKLTLKEIKTYFSQLILGLDYLHATLKIAHRDIKPDNLLIPEFGQLKIADFGVSEDFRGNKNDISCMKVGTTALHPPEIFTENSFSAYSCDIWAAGCTLYYMTTGKFPFKGKNKRELGERIVEAKIDMPEDLDENLKSVLIQCLKKNPKKRATTNSLLMNSWLFPNKFSKMNTLTVI